MAEHVQAALDQMVAPLRDLMDRNIFSETEIKAIVARRRESEYLLRRVAARKADFLRYIEQEMALERLRELRTLKRKRDHRKSQQDNKGDSNDQDDDDNNNGSKDKQQQHIGDVHIVQHIHLLFVRSIRKFRSDLSLHLQHAEFCKQHKSWTRLGRVYAEALQIFPRQSGLWIEAASHEFFGPVRSIRNARVLLQRGLRLNEHSEELWQEYFTLEMHYAQTLKGRRQILQSNQGDDNSDDDDEAAAQEEYKIAAIVLKNAFKAVPKSMKLRLSFMDTCKDFPNTTFLMNLIQESIGREFASKPESWIARALYEAHRQSNEDQEPPRKRQKNEKSTDDPVLSVLRQAVDAIETDEMLLQSLHFVVDYRTELQHRGVDESAITTVDSFMDEIWAKGKSIDACSDLAVDYANYLINYRDASMAVETIRDHCSSRSTSASARAWFLLASLSPREKQRAVLELAVRNVSMEHSDYVAILLQLFGEQIASNAEDTHLFDLLQQILILAPKTTDPIMVEDTGLEFEIATVFDAYLAYLKHAYEQSGIKRARKVYSAVLYQSSVTLSEQAIDGIKSFVDTCLKIEKSEAKLDKMRLRRLNETAMQIFAGTAVEDVYREERNNSAVFA